MKRGNFIVSKTKREKKKKHNTKIKERALKNRLCNASQTHYRVRPFRLCPFPQIWLQKHKVNQGASRHENITESQIVKIDAPNNNRDIKQDPLFNRQNMAGLMTGYLLTDCTKYVHVWFSQYVGSVMYKSMYLIKLNAAF